MRTHRIPRTSYKVRRLPRRARISYAKRLGALTLRHSFSTNHGVVEESPMSQTTKTTGLCATTGVHGATGNRPTFPSTYRAEDFHFREAPESLVEGRLCTEVMISKREGVNEL